MKISSFLRKTRGIGNWVTSRSRSRCAFLLYHRVDEDNIDPYHLCVRPENFAAQMEILSRSGRAISLPEWESSRRKSGLPSGKVCVTFDDGYLDNLANALPILEKYEIPATVFVVTGSIGKPFWWDRLNRIILQDNGKNDAAEFLGVSLDSGTKLRTVLNKLEDDFRSIPSGERDAKLDSASRLQSHHGVPTPRSLNESELKKLSSHPLITIGAHTVSHTRLASLDFERQKAEISDSASTLSRLLEREIRSFSYPYGLRGRDFNEDTERAVRESCIDLAFSADRNVVTGGSDPYALPRIWINDWNPNKFRKNLKIWL